MPPGVPVVLENVAVLSEDGPGESEDSKIDSIDAGAAKRKRKRPAAGAAGAAPTHIDGASWELIKQLQGEDAAAVAAASHHRKKRRPSQVDAASWRLIRQLQEGYAADDAADAHFGEWRPSQTDDASWRKIQRLQQDEFPAAAESHGESRRKQTSTANSDDGEGSIDASLALATKLQEEEDCAQFAARLEEEILGKEAAQALQAEEEKRRGPATKEEVMRSLDLCQQSALLHVQEQARPSHEAALLTIRSRVVSLGHKAEDLDRCLEYIRDDAPVIIHLSEDTLAKLTNDTHYRSLFETNTSGGSRSTTSRSKWENAMFGGSYDGCLPSQRPKYGCLNVTGDIAGVSCARSYGSLYMTLAPPVRHRCTFFDKDTGGYSGKAVRGADTLATAELYAHVLNGYSDEELRAVLGVSRIAGGPSRCAVYKEVQIHGPVCLSSDVQALSVPGHEADATAGLLRNVGEFQKKTGCNVLWQGDLVG